MKYNKPILSFVAALVSFVALPMNVDVIRVISSSTNSPTYIRFEENPSIKYSDSEVIVTTQSNVLAFDFKTNPSIVFMQIDEKDLTDVITITATDILSKDDLLIYNASGQLMDKSNLAPGNYFVKTPSQTFKIFKK